MAAVTTSRSVDLGQLDAELGSLGLSAVTAGEQTTVTGDVDEATLQAAIDAHVPAEPPPSEMALMQQQVNELTDLIIFGL